MISLSSCDGMATCPGCNPPLAAPAPLMTPPEISVLDEWMAYQFQALAMIVYLVVVADYVHLFMSHLECTHFLIATSKVEMHQSQIIPYFFS